LVLQYYFSLWLQTKATVTVTQLIICTQWWFSEYSKIRRSLFWFVQINLIFQKHCRLKISSIYLLKKCKQQQNTLGWKMLIDFLIEFIHSFSLRFLVKKWRDQKEPSMKKKMIKSKTILRFNNTINQSFCMTHFLFFFFFFQYPSIRSKSFHSKTLPSSYVKSV